MKAFSTAVTAACLLNGVLAAPSKRSVAATVTGVDLQLPTQAFGGSIEGASVNAKGHVAAADFRAGGQAASAAYAFFSKSHSGAGDIVDSSDLIFNTPNTASKPPLIAGGRFLKDGRLLLADATNQRVIAVNKGYDFTTFCTDSRMLQPNDLALNQQRDTLIYLSGQNFTSDTTAGVSGDLWTCDGGAATQFPPSILAAAGIHRTNGIEVSADGYSLYVSSAQNVGGAVVANKIFRFSIDPNTGHLREQAPTLFFDFTDDAATDIDGMRSDTKGNLFVTRNGEGKVVKLSKKGKLLQTIVFPNMGGPSNLEFGGPKGSTLFAIGKCASNPNIGCAAAYETNSVGRAFANLQGF